jgi:hypothetical protein
MAVDVDNFLARFPEFEPATEPMIREAIADAVLNVDADIFGTKTDQAVKLRAAHYLAVSEWGKQARMISKDGSTTYGVEFTKLARSVTPGFRVA